MKNYSKVKQDVEELVVKGKAFIDKIDLNPSIDFQIEYQAWYSLACRLIDRMMPERLSEFKYCYLDDDLKTGNSYSMSHYFMKDGSFYTSFQDCLLYYKENYLRQLSIISGVSSCFDSALLDIKSEVIYEYQEDEIEAAKEVSKLNLRAAGVIGRVVIEKHLKTVVENKAIEVKSRFKDPGLSDYITALRTGNIIHEPEKKKLEYLKEIGNKCAHEKESDPTSAEIEELLDGARWCIANIF